MKKTILKAYHRNFDQDELEFKSLLTFARDAIDFIYTKDLYAQFTTFQVKKRELELKNVSDK